MQNPVLSNIIFKFCFLTNFNYIQSKTQLFLEDILEQADKKLKIYFEKKKLNDIVILIIKLIYGERECTVLFIQNHVCHCSH